MLNHGILSVLSPQPLLAHLDPGCQHLRDVRATLRDAALCAAGWLIKSRLFQVSQQDEKER